MRPAFAPIVANAIDPAAIPTNPRKGPLAHSRCDFAAISAVWTPSWGMSGFDSGLAGIAVIPESYIRHQSTPLLTSRGGRALLNVLFITADQWRGECLSDARTSVCAYPAPRPASPSRGVLFTRHYSQATPCGPGRASLYTGLYLHNHRVVVNGTPLDARHTNVALEARKLGYEPVAVRLHRHLRMDPRTRPPGDRDLLRTYGGVLPGMTPVVPMDDDHWPWRQTPRCDAATRCRTDTGRCCSRRRGTIARFGPGDQRCPTGLAGGGRPRRLPHRPR